MEFLHLACKPVLRNIDVQIVTYWRETEYAAEFN